MLKSTSINPPLDQCLFDNNMGTKNAIASYKMYLTIHPLVVISSILLLQILSQLYFCLKISPKLSGCLIGAAVSSNGLYKCSNDLTSLRFSCFSGPTASLYGRFLLLPARLTLRWTTLRCWTIYYEDND